MISTDIPYKFAEPWATAAGGSYITNPIPTTSVGGNAGQDLGFPPITMQPPASGGIPPEGPDFNGLEFYNTSWLRWVQAGGAIPYDATFQSNVGGYPSGARVNSAVAANVIWRSTTDDNVTDPDTEGAGWVNDFAVSGFVDDTITQVLPSGVILQTFFVSLASASTGTFNFPVEFPTHVFAPVASLAFGSPGGSTPPTAVQCDQISLSQFTVTLTGGTGTWNVNVFAMGD
jgi:hypothetical protein